MGEHYNKLKTMENKEQCYICLRETDNYTHMPCCGKPDGTVKFCLECLTIITEKHTNLDKGVGPCPICKGNYKIENGKVDIFKVMGECKMCMGGHYLHLVKNGYCAACLDGMENTYKYECHKCHEKQRIPHPMYKYQANKDSYSGATWACHVGCGTYTHWKLVQEYVDNLPLAKWPNENFGY